MMPFNAEFCVTTEYLYPARDLRAVVAGKRGEWHPKVRGYCDGAEIGVAFYDITYPLKADATKRAGELLQHCRQLRLTAKAEAAAAEVATAERKPRAVLRVAVFADTQEEAEAMADQLARAACDIANTSSETAHIAVAEYSAETIRLNDAAGDLLAELKRCLAETEANTGYDRQDEIRTAIAKADAPASTWKPGANFTGTPGQP